ncbi:hypothetical protein K2Y11_18305, partial [bacterium]|nr:hypothetical protein [bacterium]
PLATLPSAVASEAAKHINWNLVLIVVLTVLAAVSFRWARLLRSLATAAAGWTRKRLGVKEVRRGE